MDIILIHKNWNTKYITAILDFFLQLSNILMRAVLKSTSHLVNLVNIATGRSTIKLCYEVNSGALHFIVHSMMPFHAGFPNNIIPQNI